MCRGGVVGNLERMGLRKQARSVPVLIPLASARDLVRNNRNMTRGRIEFAIIQAATLSLVASVYNALLIAK